MFNKQELEMIMVLLHRVDLKGNEARNFVAIENRIMQEMQNLQGNMKPVDLEEEK